MQEASSPIEQFATNGAQPATAAPPPHPLPELLARVGIDPRRDGWQSRLPFATGDVTAGTENELATCVQAAGADADFALTLAEESRTGFAGPQLEAWLASSGGVWHHAWVRVRWDDLSTRARAALRAELAMRSDAHRFHVADAHGDRVRLPASQVLRLALVDAIGDPARSPALTAAAERVQRGIINDNTAPEILSAYLACDEPGRSVGAAAARETALRHLLVQALAAWGNTRFGLRETGQRLEVFSSPNPPERLQALARVVPAEVYRRLLLNPCLGGFDEGEAKAAYMHLCHETLSRSRLAASARLRREGIGLSRDVTRLPCDTSLLNSGTHVSLGSKVFGEIAVDGSAGAATEKWYGDLVTKVFEHFLPLFVGTYAAAPARLPVSPLRPEQTLGFLPLELAAPQLRQTWAAWRRKAGLLGTLRGDIVPDARLLDYFAALPSLEGHEAHDGTLGSETRLLAALESAGVYSGRMSFYDLYKLRSRARMGFSGFEARFYSTFPRFEADMGPAVDLQRAITLAAWSALARGAVGHQDVPDDPRSQAERRQMLFHAAIGVPFFYVHRNTRNRFLLDMLARTRGVRASKRYPTHFKVGMAAYGQALCDWLRTEGSGGNLSGGAALLDDAAARMHGEGTASALLLNRARAITEPGRVNAGIEAGYRTTVVLAQTSEAFALAHRLFEECEDEPEWRERLRATLGPRPPAVILDAGREALAGPSGSPEALRQLIALLILHAEFRHHRSGR